MTVAVAVELTPLADYLASVLRRLAPLPPLDLDLPQAYGNVLAEDVPAAGPWPACDISAVDGYAVRFEDLGEPPVRLPLIGDLTAASWRAARLTPGTCFSVGAGAPMPVAADTVVPADWTDQGIAAVEVRQVPKRGYGVRRGGSGLAAGKLLARAGTLVTAPVVGVLAAGGITRVAVRSSPRVVIVATGDELVELGTTAGPGQVVDVCSHALAASVADAGGHPYRVGCCEDDPERIRSLLADQTLRADLIVTSGGTGTGPGDAIRRVLAAREGQRAGPVAFTDLAVYPCSVLGFGSIGTEQVPVCCLPGDPGAALVGFELLVRPALQVLAGAEPVFRPSVRGHLLEAVQSVEGRREFRPALVTERRGGGYTVQPLAGGPDTLTGLSAGNGLMVLGERVTAAPVGTDVDVLLLERRR